MYHIFRKILTKYINPIDFIEKRIKKVGKQFNKYNINFKEVLKTKNF